MASASDLLTYEQGDHGADRRTVSDPQPDKSGPSTVCCTWLCRAAHIFFISHAIAWDSLSLSRASIKGRIQSCKYSMLSTARGTRWQT